FIGKDIINFHALFWPAVLDGAGFRTPTRIHTHGFITVNGTRMSKSRGTFINASTYLEHLEPEYLRYYYATKLNGSVDDMDINLDDFVQRVNADLVGKVVNIASRCAGFITRHFDGTLATELHDQALWGRFTQASTSIADHYESGDCSKAVREITALADLANRYIADHAPWAMIKDPQQHAATQAVCSQAVNLFRVLAVYLAPILPRMAEDAASFLKVAPLRWSDAQTPLTDHRIEPYRPLFARLEREKLDAIVAASTVSEAPETKPASSNSPDSAATGEVTDAGAGAQNKESDAFISIDDFNKIELRVARITAATPVEGADRLLQLTLDLGDSQRQVLSGIRQAYTPEALIGQLTVVVANLAPRRMRFGTSEGMVLAAGPGGSEIFLLKPDSGAAPGMLVR
ncbi:MAG: methionine--tRNA ligase subunit beta, partial [Pseudomonadales bacterium]|nr:methionine--tRNA ligase subunit beta [Pseudomonadales bacterium]